MLLTFWIKKKSHYWDDMREVYAEEKPDYKYLKLKNIPKPKSNTHVISSDCDPQVCGVSVEKLGFMGGVYAGLGPMAGIRAYEMLCSGTGIRMTYG